MKAGVKFAARDPLKNFGKTPTVMKKSYFCNIGHPKKKIILWHPKKILVFHHSMKSSNLLLDFLTYATLVVWIQIRCNYQEVKLEVEVFINDGINFWKDKVLVSGTAIVSLLLIHIHH